MAFRYLGYQHLWNATDVPPGSFAVGIGDAWSDDFTHYQWHYHQPNGCEMIWVLTEPPDNNKLWIKDLTTAVTHASETVKPNYAWKIVDTKSISPTVPWGSGDVSWIKQSYDETDRLRTPWHKIPLLLVSHNILESREIIKDGLRIIDALVQCRVKSRILTTPPASPTEGDCYWIADVPDELWFGHEREITVWTGTKWLFFPVRVGMVIWDDTDSRMYFNGGGLASGAIRRLDDVGAPTILPGSASPTGVSAMTAATSGTASMVGSATLDCTGTLRAPVFNVLYGKATLVCTGILRAPDYTAHIIGLSRITAQGVIS